MLLRKPLARRLSRLVVGLFAVQIVLTGFCLMSNQAHAMPMAGTSGQVTADSLIADTLSAELSGHCNKPVHMDGQHKASSHSGGCFHCSEPDQFVKAGGVDLPPVSPVLALLVVLPQVQEWTLTDTPTDVAASTGPPRSSSLLFSTTQRIRV